jgi:hypothetical protein
MPFSMRAKSARFRSRIARDTAAAPTPERTRVVQIAYAIYLRQEVKGNREPRSHQARILLVDCSNKLQINFRVPTARLLRQEFFSVELAHVRRCRKDTELDE